LTLGDVGQGDISSMHNVLCFTMGLSELWLLRSCLSWHCVWKEVKTFPCMSGTLQRQEMKAIAGVHL